MLDELIVRNLGVIEDAHVEPGQGLTVITGETGTGKTLLLGALRMLLGQVARLDLIGPFGDEASVEGRFLATDGHEIAAGRRLTANGRSRAYLDGSVASAAALDKATVGLVEIVGQHDQLGITRPSEIRSAIDRQLDDAGRTAADSYRSAWAHHRSLLEDQALIGGDRPALERERDLARYQAAEIGRAGFASGDDVALEARLARLRNAETLRQHLTSVTQGIDRGRDELGIGVSELRKAAGLDPTLASILEELEAVEARVGDLAITVTTTVEDLMADGEDLELSEQRLHTLNDLRRKYGPTLDDVIGFGITADARAKELDGLLDRADSLERLLGASSVALATAGDELRAARAAAARRLADKAVSHLVELGFSDPLVDVGVAGAEPSAHGADGVTLLFASDSRLRPGEIGKVASGGELSRLVLALRLSGGAGDAETLVFDEIDAGVGGSTALAVGRKLAALAETRQVLCVTHLPQVAAFADKHYVVARDGASARVTALEGSDRLEELSRMLAGLPDSERGREAAEELVTLARAGRNDR
jgi:DNA repair protein RecN (Recombination protein N)